MANLTNSAKLIEEMEKKVNSSSLATVATSGSYTDLSNKPTIPTVNDSTITVQKNGANVDSFTTNAATGKTINIQLAKADVGLGNVDNTSDANKPISNATQTALNAKADANSVYTKAEVDSAISSAVSSVYKYKGSVANYASLPTTGLTVGDVYNVEDTGDNYAWTGTAWDKLAGTVDLSSYLTKSEASSTYLTQATASTVYATKSELNNKANTADVLTKTNTTAFTPTGDYQPATKKYVDDNAGGEQNLFIITEDIVAVSTSEDTGVAPYNTSYKYTNFDINADAGIEWKEGAIYTFVVDTEMVVASAYRNVRVKIGDGAYIPVMATTSAASGNSYFAKTAIRQFQYTTKYQSEGALHVFTDSNTTYKAMTAAQATAGTATTALTISPSVLKGAIETHAPVKSVNGQTGNVTIESTSYTAGNGIDITNKEIGLDGTYEKTDYSAMQGPAPSGFHVPLNTEWQGLKTIMDGLGLTTGDSWRTNLHMPFAGLRNYSSAALNNQGSLGLYWSSSPYGSDGPLYARFLYLLSSYVVADDYRNRANGFSVRAFKDSYVAPDSTWTVVKGTLGSAGIFWNQTEGLISITDGTTGYTIQDKNLGATTVYNDGDTLSEANCGKYYQWGNNYGFAWTGSVTTSSTKVNASTYGPGNYYSSSTFIYGSEDWSSVHNDNLRGGVTGVQIVSGNLVLGDKLYKIVISTTAPASGTASNIITISTGSTKGLYVGTTKIA